MEDDKRLLHIRCVGDLKKHFGIDHDLLEQEFLSCSHLVASRPNYFRYIREHRNQIEHGTLAAVLLYDRLVKIRRKKKRDELPDERLFWDESLEEDYRLAAQAISLHNIWLPAPGGEVLYKTYELEKLIQAPKIKFSDFPLYYILAVVDSIEPIKHFAANHSDIYILENILIDFRPNGITFENQANSKLDFRKYISKAKDLENWLDIRVRERVNSFDILFQ